MQDAIPSAASKVGRPRRGTELARIAALLDSATRVFLKEGYGFASMDKVAAEAGVSTRTIYERFKNKADLLGAVISRLVERDTKIIATADLERLHPRAALTVIAETLTARVRDPDTAALFRIVATESHRFPELADKMRQSGKQCADRAIAGYLRGQISRGTLVLGDPDRAATLFLQMICAELHETLLFGRPDSLALIDDQAHVSQVLDIFLLGALPRQTPAAV
jgi:AcrR family transcriptional regulator